MAAEDEAKAPEEVEKLADVLNGTDEDERGSESEKAEADVEEEAEQTKEDDNGAGETVEDGEDDRDAAESDDGRTRLKQDDEVAEKNEEEGGTEGDKQPDEAREEKRGAGDHADETQNPDNGERAEKDEKEPKPEDARGVVSRTEQDDKADAEKAGAADKGPEELEEDAVVDEDRGEQIEVAVSITTADTTLNVMFDRDGRILTTLNEGAMQHFCAAARANVGVKSGRYYFEVRVVQTRTPADGGNERIRFALPRHFLRLGFSTSRSSLFLGASDDSVGFDSEGLFYSGKTTSRVIAKRMPFDEVFGLLLNLDPGSPNCLTVSLFRNGVRVCQPQPLPECLQGKALFPTLNFKGMVLHPNFGPSQFAPLPFRCFMLQEAMEEDVEVVEERRHPHGKHEVLVPVGLPDEGTFEWLDTFLAENPEYTELSDRAIIDWAEKSGIPRQNGYGWRRCNDRPGWDFGTRDLDDSSVKQLLQAVASSLPRSLVVMEVRNNLLSAGRKAALEEFAGSNFRKVAMVVMGEPPEAFKSKAQARLMEKKRAKAIADAKKKRASSADACKAHDQKNADDKDNAPMEVEVELSEAEKRMCFCPGDVEDLTKKDLGSCFARFCLPGDSEGFDEVRYAWQPEGECAEYLKTWLAEKKLTQRVDDVQPGQWFKTTIDAFRDSLEAWRRKQAEWKDEAARKRKAASLRSDNHGTKENGAKKSRTDDKKPEADGKKGEDSRGKDEKHKDKAVVVLDDDLEKSKAKDGKELDDDGKKDDDSKKKEETLEGKNIVVLDDEGDEKAKERAEGGGNEQKEKDGQGEDGAKDAGDQKVEAKEKENEDKEEPAEKANEAEEKTENDNGEEKAGDEKDKGEEGDEKAQQEKSDEKQEKVDAEEKEKEADGAGGEIDFDELDVFAVEDILDVGNGEPLFKHFAYEDWALLSLRFDLHALVHAFRKDMNDPQRATFHESHLDYYFNKYFKRNFNLKQYGVDTVLDLLRLVEDTVEASPKNAVLITHLSDDSPLENFVKLAEDGRRERQQAIDTGDESAVLKFVKASSHSGSRTDHRGSHGGGSTSHGRDRGSSHGYSRGSTAPTSRHHRSRSGRGSRPHASTSGSRYGRDGYDRGADRATDRGAERGSERGSGSRGGSSYPGGSSGYHSSRHGSKDHGSKDQGSRDQGSSGNYSSSYHGGQNSGGSRHGGLPLPPAPPARSGAGGGHSSGYHGSDSGHKRSYASTASSQKDSSSQPYKSSRTSSTSYGGSSHTQPSRGSSHHHASGSYGSGGGSGTRSGYTRR